MKPRNIKFVTAGRTEMLAAENFGDWHAAVGESESRPDLLAVNMLL